jgi:hypothetical protein
MEKSVRILGCMIVALMAGISTSVFQRYSAGPADGTLVGALAVAAALLTWSVTGLE